jgi:enoyl-CoA hydratase/carnithine racemase
MALVEYDFTDAVATITLNRPPVNALNAELIADIDEAIGMAEDPGVRAVVITGSPYFSVGADINGFQGAFDGGAEDRQSVGLSAAVSRLAALSKPTIAAIHGIALGGGLELAMGADLRYLDEDARVGQPEILLGLIPGAGGTQRLSRIVGLQRAKEMCLSGRHVAAEEALTIGLADQVVPAEGLLEAATATARDFATGPTAAYAAVKRAVGAGFDATLEEGLAIETEEFAGVFATDDARAGVGAFLAKEEPEFEGH